MHAHVCTHTHVYVCTCAQHKHTDAHIHTHAWKRNYATDSWGTDNKLNSFKGPVLGFKFQFILSAFTREICRPPANVIGRETGQLVTKDRGALFSFASGIGDTTFQHMKSCTFCWIYNSAKNHRNVLYLTSYLVSIL